MNKNEERVHICTDSIITNGCSVSPGKFIVDQRQMEKLIMDLVVRPMEAEDSEVFVDYKNKLQSAIGGVEFQVDSKGRIIDCEKIIQLEAKLKVAEEALIHIEEYWNCGEGSSVDAAEEAKQTAGEALAKIRGEKTV